MNKQRRRQVLAVATVYISITIGSLFFGHSIAHAATAVDAQQVYKRLITVNGIRNAPPLTVSNDKDINAYATPDKIIVNAGLLAYVHNNSELALIIGHELSHILHHDDGSTILRELRADREGAIMIRNAGYDICTGAQALKRLHSNGGMTHPDSDTRYYELGCH